MMRSSTSRILSGGSDSIALPLTRAAAFRVVLDASLEVRSAVVYASLIVILVFVPVFFLEGLSGSFFRPLALAYVLAILASLFKGELFGLSLVIRGSDHSQSYQLPLLSARPGD